MTRSDARRFLVRLGARRTLRSDRAIVEASGLFDGTWYLQAYPDVAAVGLDPLDHFLVFGGPERRDPGPRFSSRAYLERHPHVAASFENPLVHWLRSGTGDHDATPADPPLLPDPRILFVHIPKTAGTSILMALRSWATGPRSARFERGGDDLPDYLALPDAWFADARLIGGHLWYPDLLRRDLTGWSPVTLLRDPTSRALSSYTNIREDPAHPWHDDVRSQSLDAYLDGLAEREHSVDEQCRFICGEPDAQLAWETLTTAFSLATTVEHLPEFTEVLSRLIGTRLESLSVNRTRQPLDRASLSMATRRRIEALSSQDEMLVERVRAAGLVGRDVRLATAAPARPSPALVSR